MDPRSKNHHAQPRKLQLASGATRAGGGGTRAGGGGEVMKSTPSTAKAKGHHTTTHQTLQLPRYRKNLVSNKTVTLMVRVLPTDGSPRLQMHKRHVKVVTGTAATVKAARERAMVAGTATPHTVAENMQNN